MQFFAIIIKALVIFAATLLSLQAVCYFEFRQRKFQAQTEEKEL